MAWIESHQSLATHRKTMILENELHIKTPQAIGYLHLLWWWALDNAPDGNLEDIPDRIIAKASQWTGKPEIFVKALITAGFLEITPRKIHDWEDFAGRLIEKRTINRDRMRKKRATHVLCTTDARAGATVPNPTVPNSTIPPVIVPLKENYGELRNVKLSQVEHAKLVKNLGQETAEALIERLSCYMASKGKSYRSHYATLLNWSRGDSSTQQKNQGGNNGRSSERQGDSKGESPADRIKRLQDSLNAEF